MTLTFLMLTVLVAGAAVAVALGRVQGGLAPATKDRPELSFPSGPLSSADVQNVRFNVELRGYRMAEVDEALDRLRLALADKDREIEKLRGGEPETKTKKKPALGDD